MLDAGTDPDKRQDNRDMLLHGALHYRDRNYGASVVAASRVQFQANDAGIIAMHSFLQSASRRDSVRSVRGWTGRECHRRSAVIGLKGEDETALAHQTLTYDALLRQVWRVRAYVKRLRRKLSDDTSRPAYLFTERGVGYRMARRDEA